MESFQAIFKFAQIRKKEHHKYYDVNKMVMTTIDVVTTVALQLVNCYICTKVKRLLHRGEI